MYFQVSYSSLTISLSFYLSPPSVRATLLDDSFPRWYPFSDRTRPFPPTSSFSPRHSSRRQKRSRIKYGESPYRKVPRRAHQPLESVTKDGREGWVALPVCGFVLHPSHVRSGRRDLEGEGWTCSVQLDTSDGSGKIGLT